MRYSVKGRSSSVTTDIYFHHPLLQRARSKFALHMNGKYLTPRLGLLHQHLYFDKPSPWLLLSVTGTSRRRRKSNLYEHTERYKPRQQTFTIRHSLSAFKTYLQSCMPKSTSSHSQPIRRFDTLIWIQSLQRLFKSTSVAEDSSPNRTTATPF